MVEYAALREEAQSVGAKMFFVDEAHFRADAELRGNGSAPTPTAHRMEVFRVRIRNAPQAHDAWGRSDVWV